MLLFNGKTKGQKQQEKDSREILKAYEKAFNLTKDTLVKTHMPTESLVQLVNDPPQDAKDLKALKENALKLLGLSLGKENMQKLENFLQSQKPDR